MVLVNIGQYTIVHLMSSLELYLKKSGHPSLQPNVGLFLCSVGCLQKGSKQMMMDTFAHRITKTAYMLDIGHLSNTMRSKNAVHPHSL